MKKGQVELLKLGIAPIDERLCLLVESALLWVLDNSTLVFDINRDEDLESLAANVRLFVVKYVDLMSMTAGVSSESMEGLSQSFDTNDKGALLNSFANELLGSYLKPAVAFNKAVNRWA